MLTARRIHSPASCPPLVRSRRRQRRHRSLRRRDRHRRQARREPLAEHRPDHQRGQGHELPEAPLLVDAHALAQTGGALIF